MVLDSLPLGSDFMDTLHPCSPTTMMNSDVVSKTLKDLDDHESKLATVENDAGKVRVPKTVSISLRCLPYLTEVESFLVGFTAYRYEPVIISMIYII